MTATTHETLDREEARLIQMMIQAARYSPNYAKTKELVGRRFEAIDKQRQGLIKEAHK